MRLVREHVLRRFRWINGDADIWTILRDAEALNAIVRGLAALVEDDHVDVVIGIESRGFALATAIAIVDEAADDARRSLASIRSIINAADLS